MERCTKLRGECHDGRCYDDTPHACHDVNCLTERLRKQLADAQATVEAAISDRNKQQDISKALQQQVEALQAQLEQVQEERSKYIQAVGLATTCAADMQIDTSHPIEMMQEVCKRFTQRTAELEAAKAIQAIDLKNNNAYREQVANLHAELERVRGELVEATHNVNVYQSLYSTSCMDRALLENDLRDLRTLIAALPKVEGAVVVSNGYVKDSTRCHALFGADEDAALYAALLQHRQGME